MRGTRCLGKSVPASAAHGPELSAGKSRNNFATLFPPFLSLQRRIESLMICRNKEI
jgi:hypothetical protein